MKCKHCGQEIKKTNLDLLKSCNRIEDFEDITGELCGKKCPFEKAKLCSDKSCLMDVLQAWLFEEEQCAD